MGGRENEKPLRIAALLWLIGFSIVIPANAGEAKNVAVVVYAQGAGQDGRIVTRVAQTRLEQILGDNGVTVLDQEMSRELKKSWKELEDSRFLLTAEGFAKIAQKYKIDGIYRVYLNAEYIAAPEQFFTAIAHVDLQLVDEGAKVTAVSSLPMGVFGNPPSDGSTASATMTNAVQRAVDSSLKKAGYKIDDAVVPCKINFELKPVDVAAIGALDASTAIRRIPADPNKLPSLFLRTNTADTTERFTDEFACLAQSPDKVMIAAGIRVRTQYRINLTWHTTMRLVDAAENKLVNEFEVDKGMRRGTTQMLDCMFINNWRYLAAVTGNTLVMWDTARGAAVSKIDLDDRSLKSASLAFYRTKSGWFLAVDGNDAKKLAFQFVVKGKRASALRQAN